MFCPNCGLQTDANNPLCMTCGFNLVEFKQEENYNVNVLECQNITKSFNKKLFLDNISISVKSGECLGLLGDNGSGKSTIMSTFAGMLSPDSGEILYNGNKITKNDRMKIGYVPQNPILVEYLSVIDNLKLWKSVYGIDTYENIPEFLNLKEMENKKISSLSGGMKKKVCLGIALMNEPDFIIFDEAFAAVDQTTINQMINYLKTKKHIGVLYSSHNIFEITELCDRVLVLKSGKIEYYTNEKIRLDDNQIKFLYSKF